MTPTADPRLLKPESPAPGWPTSWWPSPVTLFVLCPRAETWDPKMYPSNYFQGLSLYTPSRLSASHNVLFAGSAIISSTREFDEIRMNICSFF